MATAATATATVPPHLRQPHSYHAPKPLTQQQCGPSPQPHDQPLPSADALFDALAHQHHPASSTSDSDIPFFDSASPGHPAYPNSIDSNPLMVHVQQLPTPRTSFSSGASSPPENFSPDTQATATFQHSQQQQQQQQQPHHHYQFSHLSPSPSPSPSSPSGSVQTTTLPSTFTSTPNYGPGQRSPLSASHLYQPQSYPALRSASPALNPALGSTLVSSSSSSLSSASTLNTATATTTTIAFNSSSYNNGPSIYHAGAGSTSSALSGRMPAQAQVQIQGQPHYNDHYHHQQQDQLYYEDDEKEQQKKNARSALTGVSAFLPPALNQGLSKVVQSAQAAVSSSTSKLSLPSSRPLMEGGLSSSASIPGLRIDPTSTRGMLLKLYKASKLPLLCLLWYLSSAVTNNIGKQIMNQFRYPVTLTFVQFMFVSFFCFILGSGFRMTTIRRPTRGILHMTAPLVGFQVVGHVFSSIAISRVPLSVVHTVKALSPLFTVVFYRIVLGTTYSREVYISLVPLTAGVMLACRLSLEFNNLVGLVCALASMLVFVTQNVFTKKILFGSKAKQDNLGGLGNKESTKEDDHAEEGGSTNAQKLDKINILFYSSTLAAICMIPIWLYAEGMGLMFPDESGVNHHATGHSSGFWGVAWLLLLNGVSHFFQNIFAFSVLALTSPVTYSIASLIKRIVVIVASIVYFHQTLGATQWTGVCMTFWGLWLYNSAKNAAKVRPAGGILASTAVGRRMSRNFGRAMLDSDSSLSRKGGFMA